MSQGITVAAYPEWGVGDDPGTFGGSLSQRPSIYINDFIDIK